MLKRKSLTTAAVLALAIGGVALPRFAPVALAAPTTEPAQDNKNAQVPVRVIALFSSGVGYFEHYGQVPGGASTTLRFKTQQINDILKSLVLQAGGNGKIASVDYPSQDPIDRILHSFQIDITGNPSLANLLEQLRGAKVKLNLSGEEISGTILGVESKPKPVEKGQILVPYINIITDASIRSIELDKVQIVHLEDAQLQEELNKALTALAQARDQDKKPVTIHFTGQGNLDVRIGYVVETPVWKTSYRLVLTDKPIPATQPAGPATAPALTGGKLQGWAIVENQTDNDWNNVQLSLISGRPISFIQNLYQPLYIPRPVVQPDLYASLRPQTYDAGQEGMRETEEFLREAKRDDTRGGQGGGGGAGGDRVGGANYRKFKGLPAKEEKDAAMADQQNQQAEDALEKAAPAAKDPMDVTASISSLASASKMGELFEYTVGSVNLPRQQSAMIPIITDDVEVERLSIYNQGVLPRNPLNGARIKNTTTKNLLQGPITVLESNGYAGDARIDDVPPGQERLISFGVDLKVLVDATKNTSTDTVVSGKIVKGVLQVEHREEMTQEYDAENKGDIDRTLIVEHPVHAGWKLFDTQEPIETTPALYRFKGHVAPGKGTKLVVKEQIVNWQAMELLPMDVGQIVLYQKTGSIPDAVKQALAKAIDLKNAMTDTQRQMNQKQQQLNQITAEQGRIRENMKTVADRTSAYYTRLLTKLNDQETLLEKLQQENDTLRKNLDEQRKALEDYLGSLNVG